MLVYMGLVYAQCILHGGSRHSPGFLGIHLEQVPIDEGDCSSVGFCSYIILQNPYRALNTIIFLPMKKQIGTGNTNQF